MRFCNNLHQVQLKIESLKSQIILKCLGAIKPKGLNSVAKSAKVFYTYKGGEL
jgi:hypothetical protein